MATTAPPEPRAPAPERAGAPRAPLAPLAVLGAVAVLSALALAGLGRRSLWLDEAISVGATEQLVRTWRDTGGTMAAYYALLTPWSWVSVDRWWLRLLSLLLAAAALVVVHAVARRLVSARGAAAATLATAASWLVVRYAQEARAYALVLLVCSASWWALVRAVDAPTDEARARWWRRYAVLVVLAPLAHGLAVLQFAAQVAVLASGPDRRAWLRRLRGPALGVALVGGMLTVLGASDVASWIPPLSLDQAATYLGELTAPHPLAAAVLLAATASGAAECVARHRAEVDARARLLALVPLAWGVLPPLLLAVLSVARPYLLSRYVIASAPGLALLWVLGVAAVARCHRAAGWVAGVAVAAALVVGQVSLADRPDDDWAGAASLVGATAEPSDAIVFPNASVRIPFDHAWATATSPDASPTPLSPVEPLGSRLRFYRVIAPEALADGVVGADADRIWVVDQADKSEADRYEALLDDDAVAEAFAVVDTHAFEGGVRLTLLERR